eukprot:GFYU01022524.1.p1 GENE.GFYU01022524.1~~GFYU01022524.1.p1  ORF type:complete len:573 (+),score=111.72 GFYU01022524.1:31-1749(+)
MSSPKSEGIVATGSAEGQLQPHIRKSVELYNAVKRDHVTHVISLLDDPQVDVNWANPDDNGKTALHLAASQGLPVCAALLMGKGASVSQRDDSGITPLHKALQTGDEKCIALLVDKTVSSLEDANKEIAVSESVLQETEKQLKPNTLKKISDMVTEEVSTYGSPKIHSRFDHGNVELEAEKFLLNEGMMEQKVRHRQGRFRTTSTINLMQEWSLEGLRHVPRQSLITQLMHVSHVRTIYNMAVAIMFLASVAALSRNFIEEGIILDMSLLMWSFGGMITASMVWTVLYAISCTAVICQQAYVKRHIGKALLFSAHTLAITAILIIAPAANLYFGHNPAAGLFLVVEGVRLGMKMHSWMSVNLTLEMVQEQEKKSNRGSNGDKTKEKEALSYPANVTLSNWVYFTLVPTIVYQINYPKTSKIRWNVFFWYIVEHVFCVFYIYAVFCVFVLPSLEGVRGDLKSFILAVFGLMLPAFSVFLIGFYGMLHAWLNAFAEVTQFADRQFYLDWWNATSWTSYYDKLGLIFHKWIYRHIYLEVSHTLHASDEVALASCLLFSALIPEVSAMLVSSTHGQ